MKRTILIIIFSLSICLFQSCSKETAADLVLYDFETDSDLDKLNWKCHSLFSISSNFSSLGSRSLQLELYPSKYPGLSFKGLKKNWTSYTAISFDILNPQKKNIQLIVRIDDSSQILSFADRYNKGFDLLPGKNKIRIPFEDLMTSSGDRKLNLKRIEKMILFVIKPKEKIKLYIDTIRLEKD